MPREKKFSTKMASIIDKARALCSDIETFANVDLPEIIADADAYRKLKPRLDQISEILSPQAPDTDHGPSNHSKKKKGSRKNGNGNKRTERTDAEETPDQIQDPSTSVVDSEGTGK